MAKSQLRKVPVGTKKKPSKAYAIRRLINPKKPNENSNLNASKAILLHSLQFFFQVQLFHATNHLLTLRILNKLICCKIVHFTHPVFLKNLYWMSLLISFRYKGKYVAPIFQRDFKKNFTSKQLLNPETLKYYRIVLSTAQTFSATIFCPATLGWMPSPRFSSGIPPTSFKRNGMSNAPFFLARLGNNSRNALV